MIFNVTIKNISVVRDDCQLSADEVTFTVKVTIFELLRYRKTFRKVRQLAKKMAEKLSSNGNAEVIITTKWF